MTSSTENSTEKISQEKMLQFHGKLLSGFSHELKNHLAIINESKGLLHDYIEMGMISDKVLCDKLENILSQLDNRTDMITTMAHHLNSFSHRFDTPSSTFDLNELIIEQLFFLQRSARLKKIVLTTSVQKDGVSIFCNSAHLQFAFNHIINSSLNLLDENDQLHISTEQQDPNILIVISLTSKSSLQPSTIKSLHSPELDFYMQQIGASISVISMDERSIQIALSLPMGKG